MSNPFEAAIRVLESWADCQSLRDRMAPAILRAALALREEKK